MTTQKRSCISTTGHTGWKHCRSEEFREEGPRTAWLVFQWLGKENCVCVCVSGESGQMLKQMG